jgi:hypothetical protein
MENDSGVIEISTLELLSGYLPVRILRLVREWASTHQDELIMKWQLASSNQEPGRIEPLE